MVATQITYLLWKIMLTYLDAVRGIETIVSQEIPQIKSSCKNKSRFLKPMKNTDTKL